MKIYNCLSCDAENKVSSAKMNKYCNNTCQQDHRFRTIHVPEILEGKKTWQSASTLRRYVVETHGEDCTKCGVGTEWNDEPLVLQLDHIDGNCDNNFPDNLRLLCPNCHSQTPTWGAKGRNVKAGDVKRDSRNTYRRKRYQQT